MQIIFYRVSEPIGSGTGERAWTTRKYESALEIAKINKLKNYKIRLIVGHIPVYETAASRFPAVEWHERVVVHYESIKAWNGTSA